MRTNVSAQLQLRHHVDPDTGHHMFSASWGGHHTATSGWHADRDHAWTTLGRALTVPLDRTQSRHRRPAGACPCDCNSGGFCGGCGHAGCGQR